jgi:hypothetical protein
MNRMDETTRHFWNIFVERAIHHNKRKPHIDWEILLAVNEHIKFLEYSNAWKLSLLENNVSRGLTTEDVSAYITETIESERQLLGKE